MRKDSSPQDEMVDQVGVKERRKLQARRREDRSIWAGLGVLGAVGWSVMIPTLIGLVVGIWIDANWASPIPWTLTLLVVGIVVGCVNAWYWVMKEQKTIEQEREAQKGE